MFSVMFEVKPRGDQWDSYLANATMLRPELERVEGFVDNIRYKSLTREGWILSLSNWRDEKAVVRWRTAMRHHETQEKGRSEILADYHLRVGQVTQDNRVPAGYAITEQRLDETEVGEGTAIILITDERPQESESPTSSADCAKFLGLDPNARDMVSWDVFEAVSTPSDLILLLVFKDHSAAEAFIEAAEPKGDARLRAVRIVRDYGMFDRREAPQYYPGVPRPAA